MTDVLPAIDEVIEPMREPLRRFAALVRELGGSNAKALSLIGAIAAGTFDASRHTARSVLVLARVDLPMLRRLSGHGMQLGKDRIAAPLVMTPDYIRASCDSFPLELIEIQQKRLTLFGSDYFEELQFDAAHVRLQCERELKSVLIGLRQGLLASAGRERLLSAFDTQAAETLVRTLRGILWLKGQRDGRPGREVVGEVERLLDRKLSGLTSALDPSSEHRWEDFETLYHDVEGLGETANAW